MNLNIICETIKPLEENTGKNLHDLGLGKEFDKVQNTPPSNMALRILNILSIRNLEKRRCSDL